MVTARRGTFKALTHAHYVAFQSAECSHSTLQGSGIRDQGSGIRDQESEIRHQGSGIRDPESGLI